MREQAQIFDPRQVMRKDSFEVFHYKQPRPNAVEVHHHDFYEVYFLLGGQIEYWVEGRLIRMAPGDLLLINPLQLHRPVQQTHDQLYERIVLWIHCGYLQVLAPELCRCFDENLPNHISPAAAEQSALKTQLLTLVREHYSNEFGSEACARGLFLQFMVQLNRLALHTDRRAQESQPLSELVQQSLEYIAENIGQNLSLEGIAGNFFVSKYHLAHAFSREVGVSVYRYIMLKRLLMARQMLSAGEPAGQVCRDCGFSDYTSFYRAFKAEYGISPREVSIE